MTRITLARTATLGGILLLILLLVIWYGWLSPAPVWLALFLLPLLFPLPGLARGRPYTHAWTSFLILIYFIHGCVEAWANPPMRIPALLEVALSVIVYLGAILYARWGRKAGAEDPR